MKTAEIFDGLLEKLHVGEGAALIASRRDEITKALNKDFRSEEGSTKHRLMVGSYGRHTAIRGVSDLDLLYILPATLRSSYSNETGPKRLLTRVKNVLQERYPNTEVRVDQCVVRVQFTTNRFKFEVQPVFEMADESFDYPDTVAESWKVTKPRDEIRATQERNDSTSKNMRHLARMARAWKNANGVNMGGLLIDTLVDRFFSLRDAYDAAGADSYDFMVRDFFKFLGDEPDQIYYLALGSNQRVKVKKRFQPKAKKAYKLCIEAIDVAGEVSANKKWKAIFGTSVPQYVGESAFSFTDTEEFIENEFPLDIRHSLEIECEVTQDGWRPASLREMILNKTLLKADKTLDFSITECSVEEPYAIKWKVLNRGAEAERRNQIRGQIVAANHQNGMHEKTMFRGEHVVECFIVKDEVVVARTLIDVPISA